MFKKSLALLTLASVLVLAGCGSKPAAPAATADANKQPDPVTITFWHTYNPDSNENKTLTDVVIPAFQKKYPYITVKATNQPTDNLHDQLITAVAAGTNPDVMRMDIIWTPEFANQGALESVDNYPGFADLSKAVLPGTLATNQNKGKHYGLPLDTNTTVMVYRKDALAKAGLKDAPKTMDEFNKYIAANKGKDSFPFAPGGNDEWGLAGGFFMSLGGKITNDQFNKATGFLNSDASVKALQQLVDWQKDGSFMNTNLGGQPGTWEGFKPGKYGAIQDGPWFFAIMGNDPAIKDQVVPGLIPAGPGGSVSVVGGENIVMFANSKKKDAAWKFMQFLLSDEAQVAFAKTGQIPVTNTALASPEMKAVSYYAPYLEQLKTAQPRTPVANYNKINKIVGDAFEAALRGKVAPKAALDDAAAQIDPLLAQ